MKNFFILSLTLVYLVGCSQTSKECEELLSAEVKLGLNSSDNGQTFWDDFKQLQNCGLDSIDIVIFSNKTLAGSFMVQILSENDTMSKITYQVFLDKILEYKKTDSYTETLESFTILNELAQRKANIKNWEADKLLFEKLGLSENEKNMFLLFLKEAADTSKTYQDMYTEFLLEKKGLSSSKKIRLESFKGILQNPGNVNYEELLKDANRLEKPLLLYFTCYACVNARKIENHVLQDERIVNRLKQDFHFVNLYVDDKHELAEEDWIYSEKRDKTLKTVGSKNSYLQAHRFNANTQPYFVIINEEGLVIKEQRYTKSVSEFLEFLTIN